MQSRLHGREDLHSARFWIPLLHAAAVWSHLGVAVSTQGADKRGRKYGPAQVWQHEQSSQVVDGCKPGHSGSHHRTQDYITAQVTLSNVNIISCQHGSVLYVKYVLPPPGPLQECRRCRCRMDAQWILCGDSAGQLSYCRSPG